MVLKKAAKIVSAYGDNVYAEREMALIKKTGAVIATENTPSLSL